MTTIAYRDGVIAADTLMTCDGSIMAGRVKIARADDGRLIGASGASGFGDAFRKWALTEQGEPPKLPEHSAGFIIDRDGSIRIFDADEGGAFEIRPPYFAMGSGQNYAIGAMHAGAGAEAAVRAAIAHDPLTNGDVLVLAA
jgi:ATP-dependent HslUV protease subunit HslV